MFKYAPKWYPRLFVTSSPSTSRLDETTAIRDSQGALRQGPQVCELLDDFIGENIVIINGDRWKFQRKALDNLFTARALRDHTTPIVQKCALALQRVFAKAAKTGEVIDVHHIMGRFTLETFAEIEFGSQLGLLEKGEDHEFETAIDDANHISLERFAVPMWVWKLKRWLNVGRLREGMAVISSFVINCISGAIERRKSDWKLQLAENRWGLWRKILCLFFWTVRARPFNISLACVLAGKDTTGDATSWLMHLVHENPRVENKLTNRALGEGAEAGCGRELRAFDGGAGCCDVLGGDNPRESETQATCTVRDAALH
ncbi:unnamed protein product [Phytophthora lilii]|uniref:Unnamed protein product n=1 Tax=Phytophthora lilii TaxID=2077276 RepID=A0A9W6TT66_9STRA|nr:unnamed protein product [Phytophthora lilii]